MDFYRRVGGRAPVGSARHDHARRRPLRAHRGPAPRGRKGTGRAAADVRGLPASLCRRRERLHRQPPGLPCPSNSPSWAISPIPGRPPTPSPSARSWPGTCSENLGIELDMADLQAKLGAGQGRPAVAALPGRQPTIVPPVGAARQPAGPPGQSDSCAAASSAGAPATALIGSNNWVVDGTRTANGRPCSPTTRTWACKTRRSGTPIQLARPGRQLRRRGRLLRRRARHRHRPQPGYCLGRDQSRPRHARPLRGEAGPGRPSRPVRVQGPVAAAAVVTETIKVKGEADETLAGAQHRPRPADEPGRQHDPAAAPTACQWTACSRAA